MTVRGVLLPLVIFVASGDRPVLEALKPQVEAAAGESVTLKAADASSLAKEIESGAAADLLFADDATVDRLALDDRIDRPGVVHCATGGLAIVAAKEVGFKLPGRFDGATAPAFSRLPFRKLAMLPPATPAGHAAAEALDATQIFDDVEERFLPASGPDAARALLDSGGAEVAIVPLSLAVAWGLPFSPIEPSLHVPLRVSAGIVSASKNKDAARRVLGAVMSPEARETWKRFGYKAP